MTFGRFTVPLSPLFMSKNTQCSEGANCKSWNEGTEVHSVIYITNASPIEKKDNPI